jgi:DNA-binding LytR/AlgR family response regulator
MQKNHLHIALYSSSLKQLESVVEYLKRDYGQMSVYHFNELNDITKLFKVEGKVVLFFITSNLDAEERSFLKQINMRYGTSIHTVLCSSSKFAYDSWLLECFYFLALPLTAGDLVRGLQYFRRKALLPTSDSLRISYKGGVHFLKVADILYFKGSGNYTTIYLQNGKSVLVTVQLQKLMEMVGSTYAFERLGKSFSFNLANIKSLGKEDVTFVGSKGVILSLSKLYIKRLKIALLGLPAERLKLTEPPIAEK